MDELEQKIMNYAEKVNDWFTPKESFAAIFPERIYTATEWGSLKFSRKHRSLTKYGFLEMEIFQPKGTGMTRWHYRIKRDWENICPKCNKRMNAIIFLSGKEIGKYCANCDKEYFNGGEEK